MPKHMIGAMTDEVAALMESGISFHLAFSRAAHDRGVWHHENKERYNYFFRQVLRRVSRRKIRRPAAISSAMPTRQRELPIEFKRLAANDK